VKMLQLGRSSRAPLITRLWYEKAAWYERLVWCPLVPASAIYFVATALRALWWRTLPIQKRALRLKVLSVGNLTVGGNGKTPFTIYLANLLTNHRLRTGIIARGYRSANRSAPRIVAEEGRVMAGPKEVGDEAVMIAKSYSAGPVIVARRRYDAIQLLERRFDLDAVVLDDAFQHLAVARDVNLVLVNAEQAFGNGWLLPAGPMRERLSALRRASAVIWMERGDTGARPPEKLCAALDNLPLLYAALRPKAIIVPRAGTWHELPLETVAERRVVAVSGIAHPQSFYNTLRSLEARIVDTLEYPDHHAYTWGDWQNISRAARGADFVVTTEKDLVKLENFPFARDSLRAVRVGIEMGEHEEELMRIIFERISNGSDAHRSPN